MLIMTRETLLMHMGDVTGLIDQMQAQSGDFIPNTVAWFRRTEESLQRLRHPLSSTLATERAKIVASAEGLPGTQHGGDKLSKRKQERAMAVAALDHAQKLLLDAVQHIDKKFEPFYEKMAQFLAVSTTVRPVQLPMTEPRSEWLKQTWRNLAVPDELKNMYAYLNSSLGQHDRMYVLEMTLGNLAETAATEAAPKPAPAAAPSPFLSSQTAAYSQGTPKSAAPVTPAPAGTQPAPARPAPPAPSGFGAPAAEDPKKKH